MTQAEIVLMQAENAALKEKVSVICKLYVVLKPLLKVLRVFAFIKKGGKALIDSAITILDGVCEVKEGESW